MTIRLRGSTYQVDVVSPSGVRIRKAAKNLAEARILEGMLQRGETSDAGIPSNAPKRAYSARSPVGGYVPITPPLSEALRALLATQWSDRKDKAGLARIGSSIVDMLDDCRLSEVDQRCIDRLIESLSKRGNSGPTLNRKLSVLNQFIKWGRKRGYIEGALDIPRFRESEHRIRWITPEEEARMLKLVDHWGWTDLRDFIVVGVDTGMRRGEIFKLTPESYHAQTNLINVWFTKGGRPRSIPATARVREVLERRSLGRDRLDKLFLLHPTTLHNHWQILRDAMGLTDDEQFVIHALRHTCASRLVQRGVPLAVVQKWLGHANIQTTMRYAHLAAANLTDALAVLEAE